MLTSRVVLCLLTFPPSPSMHRLGCLILVCKIVQRQCVYAWLVPCAIYSWQSKFYQAIIIVKTHKRLKYECFFIWTRQNSVFNFWHILFMLVCKIVQRSNLISCVFWFVFLNAGSHLFLKNRSNIVLYCIVLWSQMTRQWGDFWW